MSGPSEIFDRTLLKERRRRLAKRAGTTGAEVPDFLLAHASDDVVERLSMINRSFERALTIGSYHGLVADRLRRAGVVEVVEAEALAELAELKPGPLTRQTVVADEEELAFAERSFDLAVAVLSLQYVNDLPGVLARVQRLLKPDGLFIGVLLGGATLRELRQSMLEAEAELTGGAGPRVMPFVDVRDAGGLLQRAGFALPVTDAETVTVSYASAFDLMRELKAMGATNVLHERSRRPVTRGLLIKAAALYQERFPSEDGEGRIRATFELVTLTGWSPDASQQKPLRPGSAEISLTEVLKPRKE